ncbi:MAG: prepilin-type N-terminal cleavage/methylation domain-containing protein [Planctomycetaceae bacterium]|nr:prepilin-type N-terminal cleavage/methylation domain-containing protein [Planctomycetaceae bacterium]
MRLAPAQKRSGFTLIELVIVVLVLGIIAAIAAPKIFDVTNDARENGTRQSLTTMRNALELYRVQNGFYPAASGIESALQPMLQGGRIPAPQVGQTAGDNSIRSFSGTFTATNAGGWAYDQGTGELHIDDASYGNW